MDAAGGVFVRGVITVNGMAVTIYGEGAGLSISAGITSNGIRGSRATTCRKAISVSPLTVKTTIVPNCMAIIS